MQLKKPRVKSVSVLLASKPIAKDSIIQPHALRWQDIPQKHVKPYMITKAFGIERVIGSVAKTNIKTNQVIAFNQLNLIAGGVAARLLKPGMVAINIQFPKLAALSRLIHPGDKIDILLRRKQGDAYYNHIILSNITVMNIAPPYPKKFETDSKKKKQALPVTLVLAVTTKQIQKLNIAQKLGDLSIILKSAHGNGIKPTLSDFMRGNVNDSEIDSSNELHEIEVLRGLKKTKKVLK